MSNLVTPTNIYIPSQFKKIIEMVEQNHNDMDLGKAVRKLISDYNEAAKKPPFTDDYTQ